MNNICLLGIGIVGLIYLTSKNKKKHEGVFGTKEEDKKVDSEEKTTIISSDQSIDTVAGEILNNKYLVQNGNVVVLEVPLNDIFNVELHPFVGFDYIKLSYTDEFKTDNVTVGRYIELDDENKERFKNIIPNIEYCHVLKYNNGKELTLVKINNNLVTLSAITLHFIESINKSLSICKMKSTYKKVIRNYTCKNIIEPPIPWYNKNLFDEDKVLYKQLCDSEQTSMLETDEVLDTELLDNSDTSTMEDENSDNIDNENNEEEDNDDDSTMTSDNEEIDLNNELSETSMDNDELSDTSMDDNVEENSVVEENRIVEENVMGDTSDTSMNNMTDVNNEMNESDTSVEGVSSNNMSSNNLSETSNTMPMLENISDTSFNETNVEESSKVVKPKNSNKGIKKKASNKKASKKKASKKEASKKKPKKDAKKEKKDTKKEKKDTKKKKPNKSKKASGGSESLEGGSSSSLYNAKKSILNRI